MLTFKDLSEDPRKRITDLELVSNVSFCIIQDDLFKQLHKIWKHPQL